MYGSPSCFSRYHLRFTFIPICFRIMERYLQIGKITSIHGVRGECNAEPWCDSPSVLCRIKKLYSKGGTVCYDIERARPKGNMVILKIKGIDTAEAAQAMRNTVLYADRTDIKLPEGSYFIADLIGLEAVTEQGELLGKITDVLETGANDVYEITNGDKKYYIPAIPSVVLKTDVDGGRMTVFPMEGLFD